MALNDLDELDSKRSTDPSDFYPDSAFSGGFGDSNDVFDPHNPFADIKPQSESETPSLTSPIASSSASAFLGISQHESTLYSNTSNVDFSQEDKLHSPYQQDNQFTSFDIPSLNSTNINDLEDEGGFDGQKLTLPDTQFSHLDLSDNGFADHDFSQPVTSQFMPDDPAFQDQELLDQFSQPVPQIVSPVSPPLSRPFEESNVAQVLETTLSRQPSSPTETPTPSAAPPAPAPFRPFGVTATLTSSTDEPLDESLLNNSSLRSVHSTRPPLPDILGGGTLNSSALLPDSRGALPAFKKSPKKATRVASSNPIVSAPDSQSPPSHRDGARKERSTTDIPKPYRPLGLKIAEAKPITAIVASEPPAPSPSSTPSQLPAPKLAQPVLTTSSGPEQMSNTKFTAHETGSSIREAPGDLQAEATIAPTPAQLDVRRSGTAEDSETKITTSSSTESSDPPAKPEAAASIDAQSVDMGADSKTGPNLSIIVPVPPSSLPGVWGEATPHTQVKDSVDEQQDPSHHLKSEVVSPANAELVPVPTVGLSESVDATVTSPTASVQKPQLRSDSDSEDERPLASVRDGLVQQQSSHQNAFLQNRDPSTGLTPTTPAQTSFGSQDPLRYLPIQPPGPRYKCSVGDPQKMGMINDIHTVYTVKTTATDPSASGPLKSSSTVLRRFRDFVWLFDALTSNNPGVVVPPIPDKNLRSRFQEGFIATRRVALEIFLQKTANHPMLVSDPDLKLFLESDSFSLEIKHRKPDSSSQSGWLANIAGPRFTETDDFFDHRKSSLDSLEAQLKTLHSSLSAASKTRRSYSQSLSELSQALLTLSTCDLSKPIRNALDRLAGLHRQCHAWSEEQSKQELEGLTATVEAYSRLINSVRLTFTSRIKTWEKWQVSLNNLRKVQVNHDKAKRYSTNEHSTGLMYSLSELVEAERKAQDARNEFGDVSKLIKAEMQRFDTEKVEDFKTAICAYVDGITERQRQIVHVWQEYYQLLQSLTQQNAEVASQPPKAAQEASQASESTHENREPSASTLPSTGVEHWQQSGSDPNGHAPTPTADVAVDPSPWSNESPQRHVSPPPSTGNVEGEVPPPHVFEDDPNSQIDSTIDYPITPGFEDGVGDY